MRPGRHVTGSVACGATWPSYKVWPIITAPIFSVEGELVDDLPVLQTRYRRSPEGDGLAGGRDALVVPLVSGGPGEHDHDMIVLGGQHLVGGRLEVGERGSDLFHPGIVVGRSATPDVIEELQKQCLVLFRRHVDQPLLRAG